LILIRDHSKPLLVCCVPLLLQINQILEVSGGREKEVTLGVEVGVIVDEKVEGREVLVGGREGRGRERLARRA